MSVIGLGAFRFFRAWRLAVMPAPVLSLVFRASPSLSAAFYTFIPRAVCRHWLGVIVFLVTRALLDRLGEQWDKPDAMPKIILVYGLAPRDSFLLSRAATFQSGVVYAAIIVVYFAWFMPASGEQSALRPGDSGASSSQSASPRKTVAG